MARPELGAVFTGLGVPVTHHPARPEFDIKAETLMHLGSNHRAFLGRRVLCGSDEMIVDSTGDLGDGWWRFRLIPTDPHA